MALDAATRAPTSHSPQLGNSSTNNLTASSADMARLEADLAGLSDLIPTLQAVGTSSGTRDTLSAVVLSATGQQPPATPPPPALVGTALRTASAQKLFHSITDDPEMKAATERSATLAFLCFQMQMLISSLPPQEGDKSTMVQLTELANKKVEERKAIGEEITRAEKNLLVVLSAVPVDMKDVEAVNTEISNLKDRLARVIEEQEQIFRQAQPIKKGAAPLFETCDQGVFAELHDKCEISFLAHKVATLPGIKSLGDQLNPLVALAETSVFTLFRTPDKLEESSSRLMDFRRELEAMKVISEPIQAGVAQNSTQDPFALFAAHIDGIIAGIEAKIKTCSTVPDSGVLPPHHTNALELTNQIQDFELQLPGQKKPFIDGLTALFKAMDPNTPENKAVLEKTQQSLLRKRSIAVSKEKVARYSDQLAARLNSLAAEVIQLCAQFSIQWHFLKLSAERTQKTVRLVSEIDDLRKEYLEAISCARTLRKHIHNRKNNKVDAGPKKLPMRKVHEGLFNLFGTINKKKEAIETRNNSETAPPDMNLFELPKDKFAAATKTPMAAAIAKFQAHEKALAAYLAKRLTLLNAAIKECENELYREEYFANYGIMLHKATLPQMVQRVWATVTYPFSGWGGTNATSVDSVVVIQLRRTNSASSSAGESAASDSRASIGDDSSFVDIDPPAVELVLDDEESRAGGSGSTGSVQTS